MPDPEDPTPPGVDDETWNAAVDADRAAWENMDKELQESFGPDDPTALFHLGAATGPRPSELEYLNGLFELPVFEDPLFLGCLPDTLVREGAPTKEDLEEFQRLYQEQLQESARLAELAKEASPPRAVPCSGSEENVFWFPLSEREGYLRHQGVFWSGRGVAFYHGTPAAPITLDKVLFLSAVRQLRKILPAWYSLLVFVDEASEKEVLVSFFGSKQEVTFELPEIPQWLQRLRASYPSPQSAVVLTTS